MIGYSICKLDFINASLMVSWRQLRCVILAGGGPELHVGSWRSRSLPVTHEDWRLKVGDCAGGGWRPSLTSVHITCELSLGRPVCDVEGCDAGRHSRHVLCRFTGLE